MANLIQGILPEPKRPITSVHPDMLIKQCVKIMNDENIGALLVTDDTNTMGIVSERDIVRSLNYGGMSLESATAADILHADVAILKPSDTIEMAMAVITETKRRHILIAKNGQLIAMLSIGDILLSLLNSKSQMIDQLTNYINQ